MSSLFKKPKDVRWVDMAIWIDENFYNEDCDYDTAYTYMYLLASMLAAKHKYFNTKEEYEDFAAYLAYDTYKRMSDPTKTKIKSVLNYMKSIISFRRMGFNQQRRQKIIDPNFDLQWDPAVYVERCRDAYEATFTEALYEGICEVLKQAPQYILKSIPKVYKTDKVFYKNLYISCLLSMINSITLPEIVQDRFDKRAESSPSFNEVNYYTKYLDNNIILWHIPKSLEMIVITILNKANCMLINEIKDSSNDFKVSTDEMHNILNSGFPKGDKNETNY